MSAIRVNALLLALAVAIATLAWLWMPAAQAPPATPRMAGALADPAAHVSAKRAAEVRQRFDQAVVMLHAREYEHAAAALHRVLELEPTLVEAHVNMGFALLGAGRAGAARDFFASAIELRARQGNAYYGLALAHEAEGDLAAARGAMRTYLHLSRADDPHRTKARAALWEWEEGEVQHAAGGGATR